MIYGTALLPQWREVYNDSGEEIPAFAIMRISGARKQNDQFVLEVKQPDTFGSQGQHVVNGPQKIATGKYGQCLRADLVSVLYDSADGTPAFGEQWGPRSGSWKLRKNTGGFVLIGNVNTTETIAVIQSSPMTTLRGTTDAAHNKGAAGTISIFMGNDNGTDTTVNMADVWNAFGNVASAKRVLCTWQGDHAGKRWHITAAEC
jgi:hypothetical protein